MPKRRNPFGDGSPLQFKTHVGVKELNMGVTGEHNMKAVYEKTKQLLFSGAQTLYNNGMVTDANDNHPFVVNNNEPFINKEPHASGQLVMDSEGQLALSSMLRQNGEEMEVAQENASSSCGTSSGSCKYTWDFLKMKGKKPSSKSQHKCAFCEKILKQEELLHCHLCQGSFCQLCSTTNYDESFERVFCLNCLT